MLKYNKIMFLLVFLVILITPFKKVYLEVLEQQEITKRYNNYYFFVEPFDENYQESTTNYALFAPPKLGFTNERAELVQMSRTTENASIDRNISTYYKFYQMKDRITSVEFVPVEIGNEVKYCRINIYQNVTNGEYNTYYTHGCWGRNDHDWRNYYSKIIEGNRVKYCDRYNEDCIYDDEIVNDEDSNNNNYLEIACASVNKFYDPNNANVNVSHSTNNNIVLKVKRNALSITNEEPNNYEEVKIGVNYNPQENISSCPNGGEHYVNPMSSGKMQSPVLAKYSYNVNYYQCKNEDANISGSCNSSNTINQSCSKTTIETGNSNEGSSARAEFSISQTGTTSNILTPSTIYQGGGIKIGFMYYNTIDWEYAGGLDNGYFIDNDEAKEQLIIALKNRFKNDNEMVNSLNVSFSIEPNVSNINDINNNLIKSCTQSINGDFNSGQVNTVCTVFLPVTKIAQYSGKISGISATYGDGINNKLYTELDYSGILNFSANISGLNIIKDDSDWSVQLNPNGNDTSCQINVYNRLYAEKNIGDKSNRYKFIYRPIDLNNPFPDRVAGANWYDWYIGTNIYRLEESYSKLQYQVALNPSRVSQIKKYNNGKNYLDWDNFNDGESDFIHKEFSEYFDVKSQNIVGDSS